MSGKNSGGSTGKNVSGGGGGGTDPNALGEIRIVNGDLIVTTRGGTETNLGKTVVQELFSDSLTVPVGNGEVELVHNLNTKNVICQVFNSNDEEVGVPSQRELNKIKFFFGTTDTEAVYTVVLAQ